MIKQLRVAWERLSLYLPVILMGLLALGTYWLVRSTPLLLAPAQEPLLQHEPDYFMRKFSVKTFDGAGRLKSEVLGTDARHFPDSGLLRWPVKLLIPVGFGLLALQGIAEIIKRIGVLTDRYALPEEKPAENV